MPEVRWPIPVVAVLAMVAFAANSWLCRAALESTSIDPLSFTSLRVVSGAVVLAMLVRWRKAGPAPRARASTLRGAVALLAYALAFSLAYERLTAGTGALLLFGAVQATVFGAALGGGHHPRPGEWLGLALALGGLVILTRPGLEAPDPLGATLMLTSGVAWGAYTLLGRGQADPLGVNASSFVRAVPLALAAHLVSLVWVVPSVETAGVVLALTSGGLTSGLGYAVWYSVVPRLTTAQAGVVQLSVPPLVALGGWLLLDETFTPRLALATLAVVAGIFVAMRSQPAGSGRRGAGFNPGVRS